MYILDNQIERTKIFIASVILFLENLRKQGVLRHIEEKWQGGHRKIYYPLMNKNEFVKYIVKTIALSMMKDFPEETMRARRTIFQYISEFEKNSE